MQSSDQGCNYCSVGLYCILQVAGHTTQELEPPVGNQYYQANQLKHSPGSSRDLSTLKANECVSVRVFVRSCVFPFVHQYGNILLDTMWNYIDTYFKAEDVKKHR